MSAKRIHIVFDGPPGHQSGRFVEAENDLGLSIDAGRWVKVGQRCPHDTDGDGHCALGPKRCREEGHQEVWHLVIDRTPAELVCEWLATLDGPNAMLERSQLTLSEIVERAQGALDPAQKAPLVELLMEAARVARQEPISGGLAFVHEEDDAPAAFAVMTLERYEQLTGLIFEDGIPEGHPEFAHEHVTPEMMRYE